MKRGLFLDRDGTLIHDGGYLRDPAGVRLLPGVREVLGDALARGWWLFLLTNQSGVGRGLMTLEDVHAVNARMLGLLQLPEPGFTAIGIAPEGPEEVPVYRKPSPRFLLEQMQAHGLEPAQCWMIGDRRSDPEAGLNAGARGALLRTGEPLSAETLAWALARGVGVWEDLTAWWEVAK